MSALSHCLCLFHVFFRAEIQAIIQADLPLLTCGSYYTRWSIKMGNLKDGCTPFQVQFESLQSKVLWRYGILRKILTLGPSVADQTGRIVRLAAIRLGKTAHPAVTKQ